MVELKNIGGREPILQPLGKGHHRILLIHMLSVLVGINPRLDE